MKIMHTEASPGWGGQELRILREAEGMRERGHEIILAIQKKGGLVKPAREAGFKVIEIDYKKTRFLQIFIRLFILIKKYRIEIVNTHSSLDSWIGGFVAKLSGKKVIRTRHLSTPIKKGINSRLLYNKLADCVVTTCESIVPTICKQAGLPIKRCRSIPTGIDPALVKVSSKETWEFREKWKIGPEACLVGTLCVLRGWKGVSDFLQAAKLLESEEGLKWMIVGSGVSEAFFHNQCRELGLQNKVIFTGHLYPPFAALFSMDIFTLLSWCHEGVSQASLQAAWLKKPLVTTKTGGLPEVCLEDKTGFNVPTHDPESVAAAVLKLYKDRNLRNKMGEEAHKLVKDKFTLQHTLQEMENVYSELTGI